MSKSTKVWLGLSIGMILSGIVVFVVAVVALGFDFNKFSTGKYETNTYYPEGVFDRISINTNVSDINFVLSDDGKCKVVSREEEKVRHTIEIAEGTLEIKVTDNRKWYDFIRIFSEKQLLTVYLPKEEYKSLWVETDTGDLKLGGFSFETIEISADTGDFELVDITCKSLNLETDTGDITLKKVIAEGNLSINTATGDVDFTKCDAGTIKLKTDTGDISGTLLSQKVFVAETSTGDINVPSSVTGGRCEIKSDTGDITVTIEE